MCQRYISPSQSTIAGRTGWRADRGARSTRMQPPRGGSHDHPREREEQQQRRDVAEQHVLDHVRGEEVVRRRARRGRDERRQQREHRRRRRRSPGAARRPRPPASRRACAEAPDVDARPTARAARARPGRRTSELGMRRVVTRHARDCRNARAARRGTALAHLARAPRLLAPPLCWSCGGAGAPQRSRSAVAAAALLRSPRDPSPVVLSGVRVWAPMAYAGPARDLVRALKFRGATARGRRDGRADRGERAQPDAGDGALVPVPLHPRRLRAARLQPGRR